jgi:hypothetical protein
MCTSGGIVELELERRRAAERWRVLRVKAKNG